MYALLYDERQTFQPMKEVLSVHKSRQTAEKALSQRMRRLKKRVWECNTRIVWVHGKVKAGEFIDRHDCSAWRPGEPIPLGEIYPDCD